MKIGFRYYATSVVLIMLGLLLLLGSEVQAKIFREVSSSGHVTFTDKPSDNAQLIDIDGRKRDALEAGLKYNKPIRLQKPDQRIQSIEQLQNLTAYFDDSILQNWLSKYHDCSNHLQRVDLRYQKYLQFFSENSPLVIPIIGRSHKSFDLYYSGSVRYRYDTEEKVLVVYRNNMDPRILYVCPERYVPRRYVNHYYKYLINQDFIEGHSRGDDIAIEDGAEFLQQECRLNYKKKEYKLARTSCRIAAASRENVAAQYYMGMLYRFSFGGEQDLKTAYKYTRASAEAGFSPAFAWMGWHYEFGKGLEINYAEALRWHIAAVDAGHLKSSKPVSRYYLQGIGGEQDFSQAAVWLTIAARAGDSHAQNSLGCMYANGIGLQPDFDKALHWINESHKQGNPKAIYNLAVLYKNNKVPGYTSDHAIPLFKRAASFGIFRTSDIQNHFDRLWFAE